MEQFTSAEMRLLRRLNTPAKIQKFLNDLPYHLADTVFSPRKVMRERTAHCFEGALFAATALRVNGYEPLILDLEAENDTDHVLAIYRKHGAWGSIAMSNYPGCRGREPIYRNCRELALSYFNDYFNLRRELTLRRFSKPVNLRRFDRSGWMTSEKDLWYIEEYLFDVQHWPLVTPAMARTFTRIDERAFRASSFRESKQMNHRIFLGFRPQTFAADKCAAGRQSSHGQTEDDEFGRNKYCHYAYDKIKLLDDGNTVPPMA